MCDSSSMLTHERRSHGLLLGAIHDENSANRIYKLFFRRAWDRSNRSNQEQRVIGIMQGKKAL